MNQKFLIVPCLATVILICLVLIEPAYTKVLPQQAPELNTAEIKQDSTSKVESDTSQALLTEAERKESLLTWIEDHPALIGLVGLVVAALITGFCTLRSKPVIRAATTNPTSPMSAGWSSIQVNKLSFLSASVSSACEDQSGISACS